MSCKINLKNQSSSDIRERLQNKFKRRVVLANLSVVTEPRECDVKCCQGRCDEIIKREMDYIKFEVLKVKKHNEGCNPPFINIVFNFVDKQTTCNHNLYIERDYMGGNFNLTTKEKVLDPDCDLILTCNVCRVVISNWDTMVDFPLYDHIKFSPRCPLIPKLLEAQQKHEPEIDLEVHEKCGLIITYKIDGEAIKRTVLYQNGYAVTGDVLPNFVNSFDKHLVYEVIGNALEEHIGKESLLASNLIPVYDSKKSDCFKCITCGLGLVDWVKGDDTILEHQKYAPHCKFIRGLGLDWPERRVARTKVVGTQV